MPGFPRCNGKVSYDKKAALTAANHRMREGAGLLRTYWCPRCNGWHIARKRTYGAPRDKHVSRRNTQRFRRFHHE